MSDFEQHLIPTAESFSYSLEVHGYEETMTLGEQVAGLLKGGEIILLHGGLGAGKTCFVQGLCRGLGIETGVVSPTFTLVNTYDGSLIVHHLDFYRVENGDNLDDIGVPDILDEVWDGKAILVVEWPSALLHELGSAPCCELLAANTGTENDRTWYLRGTDGVHQNWAHLFNVI